MSRWRPGTLDPTSTVYVAGHRGLAGSAIKRRLVAAGFTAVSGHDSSDLDLRDPVATLDTLTEIRPDVVVVAAARVGGIMANATAPASFLEDNLKIQVSLLGAARKLKVPRLLFLGSSCVYPRLADQPIREDSLMTGPLEATNQAYAIAKIAGLMQVQAIRQQDGLAWISAMPPNLFGPGDNFDPETSHVLAALLRRAHEAAHAGSHTMTIWGTGTPRREFLHVDDFADACLFLLDNYDDDLPINVGTGKDISVADLARLIAKVVGFAGELRFDPSRPDGTPRKVLDVTRLGALGWRANIRLEPGIRSAYESFLKTCD